MLMHYKRIGGLLHDREAWSTRKERIEAGLQGTPVADYPRIDREDEA
jgi:hypothetical protein